MDIKLVFYLLASIFMILGIAVMVAILLFIMRMASSVRVFQKKAENIKEAIRARRSMHFMPFINTILKWLVDRRNRETS